jgi:putative colanic acid biosynthesis UDP-glucose lipid carrier transferase
LSIIELSQVGAPPSARPHVLAGARRKRALDVVVAGLALLLFLPLLLLIAAAIRAEGPGEVLFRQARTGLQGRRFTILKFRTMRPAAASDPEVQQARRGDPRVTRVGRVLRKLSLDELPQLINVLQGEMSLVGPRPHALSHDAAWAERVPGYANRFQAKPGLTGLAQVRGLRGEIHDEESLRRRIAADLEYIETWSFAGDLKLLALTAPRVLFDPCAY